MIKSNICVDCICLPVCLGKLNHKLFSECSFMNNALDNICAGVVNNEYISILFVGLHREFTIKRVEKRLVIEDTRFLRGDYSNEMSMR